MVLFAYVATEPHEVRHSAVHYGFESARGVSVAQTATATTTNSAAPPTASSGADDAAASNPAAATQQFRTPRPARPQRRPCCCSCLSRWRRGPLRHSQPGSGSAVPRSFTQYSVTTLTLYWVIMWLAPLVGLGFFVFFKHDESTDGFANAAEAFACDVFVFLIIAWCSGTENRRKSAGQFMSIAVILGRVITCAISQQWWLIGHACVFLVFGVAVGVIGWTQLVPIKAALLIDPNNQPLTAPTLPMKSVLAHLWPWVVFNLVFALEILITFALSAAPEATFGKESYEIAFTFQLVANAGVFAYVMWYSLMHCSMFVCV